jgi:amino acid transporter
VTDTVIDTLRAALDRRIRLLLANLALAFRYIGWPVLLFIATYGLAELSTNSQLYLHSGKQLHDVIFDVLPALGWGLAAVVGLVLSAALMLFRWRVVDNTFRFLGLIGFILLLTFWIFSLALWGVNELLINVNVSNRTPFSPPSWMTGISLALLIIFGVVVFARRRRPAAKPQ